MEKTRIIDIKGFFKEMFGFGSKQENQALIDEEVKKIEEVQKEIAAETNNGDVVVKDAKKKMRQYNIKVSDENISPPIINATENREQHKNEGIELGE